jgi:BlaI family penicillinase repressor
MKLSDTEWVVMNALWNGSPATARDVWQRVHTQTAWAYSTVKTLLDRLGDKGAVRIRKRRNASLYEPRVTRSQARRAALRSLLERAFDGAFGSLVHYMVAEEKLSPHDRRELARMLQQLQSAEPAQPPTASRAASPGDKAPTSSAGPAEMQAESLGRRAGRPSAARGSTGTKRHSPRRSAP